MNTSPSFGRCWESRPTARIAVSASSQLQIPPFQSTISLSAPRAAIAERPLGVGDDRVGARDQLSHRIWLVRPERNHAHAFALAVIAASMRDRDGRLVAERSRKLPATYPEPCHLLAHRVGADEQHLRFSSFDGVGPALAAHGLRAH